MCGAKFSVFGCQKFKARTTPVPYLLPIVTGTAKYLKSACQVANHLVQINPSTCLYHPLCLYYKEIKFVLQLPI